MCSECIIQYNYSCSSLALGVEGGVRDKGLYRLIHFLYCEERERERESKNGSYISFVGLGKQHLFSSTREGICCTVQDSSCIPIPQSMIMLFTYNIQTRTLSNIVNKAASAI